MACRFLLNLAIRSAASPQENIFLKTPDDFVGGEKSNKKNPPLRGLCDALRFDFGGDEEDRTPDLRIANAALSQLSYVPIESQFYLENSLGTMNKQPLFAADPLLKHALILYQEIYIVKGFSGMYSN